jgi:uncharacterized delta-60 repeat protein
VRFLASLSWRTARPRWVLGAAILLVAVALTGTVALAAPGDLDATFAGDGKASINFGGTDRATHLAVAPGGKIVTIGATDSVGSGDYAVARFGADGTPDSSFGSGGKVTVGTAAGVDDIGGGVVVQSSGQIVVSGQGNASADFVTRRLADNGTVDGSFAGGTGTSVVDFGGTDSENAMIQQADGKLVLVGTTSATNGGDFAIVRLNADGSPDNGFGTNGKKSVDFGGADVAVSVADAGGGKIVVAGQGGAGSDMVAVRLNSDGGVDSSFAPANSGKAFVNFGGTDGANGVAVQADGKVVLDGSTDAEGSGDFAVARLNQDGTPDNSFSDDGKLTAGFAANGELALAVTIQRNGKIVVFGNGDANHDFVLVRYLSDGSPDSSFGSGGVIAVDYGGFEYDGDVALQADGKIVMAGSTNVSDGGDVAVARLQGDPVGSSPPPPPPPPKPTAKFTVGKSLKLPGSLRFSAVGSTASAPGAKLISTRWQIKRPADALLTIDTDCGKNPVLSATSFKRPGNFMVKLTVIDSLHRVSSTERFVPVTKLGVKHTFGDGVFDCENPAKGEQPSSKDCVKSFGYGFLDVNSRGGAGDCFEISTSQVNGKTLYTGKIAGPVAINGLYVPVPKGVKSSYDSDGTISAGTLSVRVGPFLTQKVDLNFKITPNKQGVYHIVNVDVAGSAPKLLGSLPVRGAFALDLVKHKSKVKVGIGLPSPLSFGGKKTAQGDVLLISDNVNGLHYDGLNIKVPDLWLGPMFINSLGFHYEKSSDSWGGTAKVTLPGSGIAINASGPPSQPPDYGFGIKKGKLHHVGFAVDFQPPTQPDLFPPFNTVLLSHIGAAVGFSPLRLTGTIGLNAAHLVEEDGAVFAAFASSNDQYTLPEDVGPELAPLANRTFDRFSLAIGGTAKLKVPVLGALPLLNAYGLYEFPDYFEFGGGFNFEVGVLTINGNVGGFAWPTDRTFNVQGGVHACIKEIKIGYKFVSVKIHPCLDVGGVVSSKGLGFCGVVPVPFPVFGTIPVTVGAGYKWGARTPDFMVFSCDYTPYAETSKLAHKSQASQGTTVTLPKGLPSAMFRVHGQGAAPDLQVTGPDGKDPFETEDALSVADGENTVIALRNPAGGKWTLTPKDGSAPITDVATAKGLEPLALKTSVTGTGSKRVLHYKMNPGGGRSVRFVERGRDTSRIIGTADDKSGTIAFTPGPGPAGTRSIIGEVVQGGAPSRNARTTTYKAPKPKGPGRPRRVRVRRSGGKLRISWPKVKGAKRYEVLVRLSDRSSVFRVVRGTHVKLKDPFPAKRGTVAVDVVLPDGTRGKPRSAKLKPKLPAKHKKRHRRKK